MDSYPEFSFLLSATHQQDLNQVKEPVVPFISGATGRALTEWALRFRDTRAWQEVTEKDIFGIRDPETGALNLVTVHREGEGGATLRCHMPPDQAFCWKTLTRNGESALVKAGHTILECTLVPISSALAPDWALFSLASPSSTSPEELVPCFRSCRPGYFPWFLEEAEATRLATVFKLFFCFLDEVLPQRQDFYRWEHPFGQLPGIPVFQVSEQISPQNSKEWEVHMEVLPSECLAPVKPRLGKDPDIALFAGKRVLNETWEIASFFLPSPVFEGSRPYFPKSAICLRAVDFGSRCPCAPILYGGDDPRGDTEVIRQAFKDLVRHCNYLPERVRVDNVIAQAALETFADEFGIEIHRDEALVLMPSLIADILKSFESATRNPDEELLDSIIRAIPEEFRSTIGGEENIDESLNRLTERMIEEAAEKLAIFEMPKNIIYGDFAIQPAAEEIM